MDHVKNVQEILENFTTTANANLGILKMKNSIARVIIYPNTIYKYKQNLFIIIQNVILNVKNALKKVIYALNVKILRTDTPFPYVAAK